MERSRWVTWFFVLLLLATLAIPVWRQLERRESQTVTLNDGSTMTLEKAGLGKVHRFGGSALHRWSSNLPAAWVKRLGWNPPLEMTSSSDALGLWFRLEGPAAGSWLAVSFELVDDTGFRSRVSANGSAEHDAGPNARILGRVFEAFPRRSEVVELRLLQMDERGGRWEEAGSFEISNPSVWRAPPAIQATPLPAVERAGELEIELKRLVGGAKSNRELEPAELDREPMGVAVFQARENGQVTESWFPDGVVLTDETGNQVKQGSWSHTTSDGSTRLSWSPTLWTEPGGWKARFEFTREPDAEFSADELFVVEDLAVPGEEKAIEVNQTFERLGHEVTVVGIAGRGGRLPGRNSVNRPHLKIEVRPPLLDKQIDIVRVVDEAGKEYRGSGSSWSRAAGSYTFHFESLPEGGRIDITMGVHASVYVEFQAESELLLSQGASEPEE